jgi:hypothetical protein
MHPTLPEGAGFRPIRSRNDEVLYACSQGDGYRGQDARDRTHGSVEPQLPESEHILAGIGQKPRPAKYGESDGEVIGRAFLAQSSGEEIDEHAVEGKFEAGIARRRANAIPRLPYGAFGETDEIDRRDASSDVYLDRNEPPLETEGFMGVNGHPRPPALLRS